MHPLYEMNGGHLKVFTRRCQHFPPHLHPFLEGVYLKKGSLAIGQGLELFSMEAGDFALIFPNMLHHFQVFSSGSSEAVFLMAAPEDTGVFETLLLDNAALTPVIPAKHVDSEIPRALTAINTVSDSPYHKELSEAYLQIILAKCIPQMQLSSRQQLAPQDLVYDVVSYVSGHYREEITLTKMAQALGVSPYVLSRIFSSVFHTNFNTYLNEVRLKRADSLLKYSDMPITEVAMNCGFSSLRTFNRFVKEKLRMTPREYRNASRT